MSAFRITTKILYFEFKGNALLNKYNVLIYGAGESGMVVKRTIGRLAGGAKYKVVGFVDDNPKKTSSYLEGVRIYELNHKLIKIIEDKDVKQLIISVPNLAIERKQEIVDFCLSHNIEVRAVPPASKWINGELSEKQIKEVNIEDLLGRTPIKLENNKLEDELTGQIILVTGSAGSIGSEIARQIVKFNPKKLILLDQGESPLYDLELHISEMPFTVDYEVVLADITDFARLTKVFETYKPTIVFHAAAYKHVPMIENNPYEGIGVNIGGTKNLADLSVKFGIRKFVMVSTDKAVNPTNVMGATKRVAEIYCQSLNAYSKTTKFVTTRFGNVLGSNGSVIPRFKKQISEGGPITITHPDITRFFMTIPEACELVLEAGSMGNGGEIFLFDMGESVKIVDLAKKMIKLSGLKIGQDIQIIFTGLRPGEKLYEELLNTKENTQPTHHPKIKIASVRENNFEEVVSALNELFLPETRINNMKMIAIIKQLVPEYKSNNSIYESLDKQPSK
jgi:FlaA1/EpsC-like NDP-sugar epimerase